MTELEKDVGPISVKVLEIKKSETETEKIISHEEEIKGFISKQLGEFSMQSRFRPMVVEDLDVEAVDSLATGEKRLSIDSRRVLWKEFYPLGVIEFEKIWALRKATIPTFLKEENKYFLFEGTRIIRSFDKKVFYLSLFYQNGRIFRYLHPEEEECDFKSLVVKRKR
jgi:hypothetical protein